MLSVTILNKGAHNWILQITSLFYDKEILHHNALYLKMPKMFNTFKS